MNEIHWTEIKSEADNPKESGWYLVIVAGVWGDYTSIEYYDCLEQKWKGTNKIIAYAPRPEPFKKRTRQSTETN